MTVNITMGHLGGFVLMVCVASIVLRGWFLIRFIGFSGLWQLLTPVRNEMLLDILLMITAWSATEIIVNALSKLSRATRGKK